MHVRSLALGLSFLLPSLGCSADPDPTFDPFVDSETFRAQNDPTAWAYGVTKRIILPALILAFVQDAAAFECGLVTDVCEGPDGPLDTKATVCTECSLACTGSRQPDGTWVGAGDCAEKKHAGADTHEHTHGGNPFPKMVVEYDYDIKSKLIEHATVGGDVPGASGSDPDMFVDRRVIWSYTVTYKKVTFWLAANDPHVLKNPKPLVGEYAGCSYDMGKSCGAGTGSSTGGSTGTASDEGTTGASSTDTGGCEWGLETGLIETSSGGATGTTGS